MEDKKDLIIFDIDETITDPNSLLFSTEYLLSKEEKENIIKFVCKTWEYLFNYFFEKLRENKKTNNDLKEATEKCPLTPGMKTLFEYLKQNKNKYYIIIISGGFTYQINHLLKYHNFKECINEIYCLNSEETKDNLLKISNRRNYNCPNCNPSQCKSQDLKDFFEIKRRDSFKNVIFICDGGNDICLAKDLNENDMVFAREEHRLIQRINDQNEKIKTKCIVKTWKSGEDIINLLKEL